MFITLNLNTQINAWEHRNFYVQQDNNHIRRWNKLKLQKSQLLTKEAIAEWKQNEWNFSVVNLKWNQKRKGSSEMIQIEMELKNIGSE